MYKQLSDAELIRKARESQREGKKIRTRFYTKSETELTGELQRRGMLDGDGQIRKSPIIRRKP